jgi:3-hydroxyisobutyrate dehydrogenase
MAEAKPEIAFIGLGAMGFGMATNLIKHGYKVTGFDVWGPTLERFRAEGGQTATTPAETVDGKSYCVCMVATAQQAQSVLIDGESPAISTLPLGAAVLLCSTVPCSYVQSLEKRLAEVGRGDILLIDSPVSGGAYRAADGTLSIMAGGSDAAISKGKFLLQEMADQEKLYIVKGGVGAGSNMKMVHQVLAAIQILSASEALGFATHLGLDLPQTAQAILNSPGKSWMFEHRSPRILHPEFQPLVSALNIIIKDTGIITAEARRNGFPTVLVSAAEQVYFSGLAKGYGPDDDSGILRVYTEGKSKIDPAPSGSEEKRTALVVALLKGIHLCAAAETIALAARLGLDLDQVFNLCRNAAGDSRMLETCGPDMMNLVRGQQSSSDGSGSLVSLAQELQEAVDEAQKLKAPIFLGCQALNIARFALGQQVKPTSEVTNSAVVNFWSK